MADAASDTSMPDLPDTRSHSQGAHIPADATDSPAGLSETHASPSGLSDQGHNDLPNPLVSGGAEAMPDPSIEDLAPYGMATTEEELRASIKKILEDMVGRNKATNPERPHSSSSAGSNINAGGDISTKSDRYVTMRRLPDNVDTALSEFLSHLFGEENLDDTSSEQDEENDLADKTFQDTRSESDTGSTDDRFYTAVNSSIDDLTEHVAVEMETVGSVDTPDADHNCNAPWGNPLRWCQPELERIHQERIAAGRAPDWPFADYLEFEFVKWMVVNDISQTARDKLIKLPIVERCQLSFSSNYALNKILDKLPAAGPRWRRIQRTITGTIKDAKGAKFLTEEIEIWVRDIIEVIRELIGNASYGQKLVFVPQRVEINGDPSNRKIDEMWTADWWMRVQNKLPHGATLVPIILSSDATQLTNFSGGKSAWPVYISIGNIPKAIRAKISTYSTLLLAYLPVPKFDCFPAKERGDQKARLFHESMEVILRPLVQAGRAGVEMNCGDGYVRHCYPILAAYIADNPEQTMIAGCRRNLCHRCTVQRDKRGDLPETPPPPRIPDHTAVALEAHDHGHTSALFDNQGLKPFGKPFWADLPHTNIFSCLTPDILHQLHKGVFKDHLMDWCLKLIKSSNGSTDDVDYRFKAMPLHSALRHFSSGVTKLKQTTANEHREMQKVFIAVMAGLVPEDVLPAILAVIDFIHFARLPVHTPGTLALLDDALNRFHESKNVFIKYDVRTDFDINKVHAMSHYVEAILELGAADAYNTETPERLHIEFAKRAYKATNRKNFFEQMTTYLERRERVTKFDAYLQSIHPEYAAQDSELEKDLNSEPTSALGWRVAKKSPLPLVPVSLLPEAYRINWFGYCFTEFFRSHYGQNIEIGNNDHLEVFPKATQVIEDAFASALIDLIHASTTRPGGSSASKFDTVLIRRGNASNEDQLTKPSYGIKSHYIGRVRLIFKLPPHYGILEPLVLVQLFRITSYSRPNKRVGMFKVLRERYSSADGNRTYQEQIVPLSHIRRTCHLVPEFGDETPIIDSNTSFDSLEEYDSFFLNCYLDLHSFQLLLS
ncbi:hypothetical protein V565_181170 [Rhizoctonia solani 123E]|uniref:Zn-finger protein n=1 Tax=Rhizoctonia solani 123E TaxID=1423351 RepID=A0A074S9X2_9AGAM|nr:hypothetical protein V565_181170 [Rhizoctonia solani 123E]